MKSQDIFLHVLRLAKLSPSEYAVAIKDPAPWMESEIARNEWRRIASHLYEKRRLWPTDVLALAMYCDTLCVWCECKEEIERKESELARLLEEEGLPEPSSLDAFTDTLHPDRVEEIRLLKEKAAEEENLLKQVGVEFGFFLGPDNRMNLDQPIPLKSA